MHRRTVLQSIAVGAASLSGLPVTGGPVILGLDTALHVPCVGELPPVPLDALNAMIHQGWKDFSAVQFTKLSAALPQLIKTAEGSRAHAPAGTEAAHDAALSAAYVLANELTIKRHLHDVSLVLADRGARAARASGDPMAIARAQWRLAISLRRSKHRDIAESIALKAAEQLRESGALVQPKAAGFYSRLLCCAAYSAALEGHRVAALANLDAAGEALREFPHASELRGFGVDSYQVSIHRMLGDYGTALHAAGQVRMELLPSTERQTRYLEDKAIALWGARKPAETFQILLATERLAPDETQMRPWVRKLTEGLLAVPSHTIGISGVREFARRNGAG